MNRRIALVLAITRRGGGSEMMWFRRNAPARASLDGALQGEIAPASHVVSTATGEEKVLLDPKRERYYTLNEVGSRIWEFIATGATVPQVVEAIREEYEVPDGGPAEQVEQDVSRLLSELVAAGLVTVRAPRAQTGSRADVRSDTRVDGHW
ncbi:MAG: PqqD family protein [Gemmatimonadaceae bacterium]